MSAEKIAYFRFYEELNKFLPPEKRKTKFAHKFKETPSIKDMIEAIGIPHTEVDLLLVNRESADFSYQVQDKDDISVYPVFESFNIKQASKVRPEPLRETKFILDVHLGKLARYLRMLGFDTLYRNDYSPEEIVNISLSQNRIIISKSKFLLKRKQVTHGYCLLSSDPEVQLRKVLRRFDLTTELKPFTRCMDCNNILDPIAKEMILSRLPQKVKEYHQHFLICPQCDKIYWPGTHHERMEKFINALNLK